MGKDGAGAYGALALAIWLGACQTSSPGPLSEKAGEGPAENLTHDLEPGGSAHQPPIDWARADDCLGKLRLLHAAAEEERLDESHEPPFALVVGGPRTTLDWVDAQAVPILANLPLPSYEEAGAAAREAPCVLEIRPARDLRSAHRVIGLEEVASEYQSGSRSEKNPDYDAAQARVREAERRTKDKSSGLMKVGDPMLDLVGLLVGGVVSTLGSLGDDDLDDALVDLKATPRSRERPVYRAYSFELQTIRAGKEATIPVLLRESGSQRVWRTEVRQREMRQVTVYDGLDPRDREYELHRSASMSRREFEHWRKQPPQLAMSAAVTALVQQGRAPPPAALELVGPGPTTGHVEPDRHVAEPPVRPETAQRSRRLRLPRAAASPTERSAATEASTVSRWIGTAADRTKPVAAADPRAASIVGIEAGGRSGSGFYFEPRLVATTSEVVGSLSVTDVTTSDGVQVLGLVVHRDPGRDLALVHVPRTGVPVPLYDGPPIAARQPVEVVDAAGGDRALVQRAILHDQTGLDQEGPGRSGAPIFLDGQVIGLVAGPRGAARQRVVRIDDLYEVLDAEALAALP